MRINIDNITGKEIIISLSSEGAAEAHQLQSIIKKLEDNNADWFKYDDMWGDKGISIRAKVKSSEISDK
jgi:hypothetical protein